MTSLNDSYDEPTKQDEQTRLLIEMSKTLRDSCREVIEESRQLQAASQRLIAQSAKRVQSTAGKLNGK